MQTPSTQINQKIGIESSYPDCIPIHARMLSKCSFLPFGILELIYLPPDTCFPLARQLPLMQSRPSKQSAVWLHDPPISCLLWQMNDPPSSLQTAVGIQVSGISLQSCPTFLSPKHLCSRHWRGWIHSEDKVHWPPLLVKDAFVIISSNSPIFSIYLDKTHSHIHYHSDTLYYRNRHSW